MRLSPPDLQRLRDAVRRARVPHRSRERSPTPCQRWPEPATRNVAPLAPPPTNVRRRRHDPALEEAVVARARGAAHRGRGRDGRRSRRAVRSRSTASTLVGIAIAVAPGEAFYLPLAHRPARRGAGRPGPRPSARGSSEEGSAEEDRRADEHRRACARCGEPAVRNLPPLGTGHGAAARAARGSAVRKTAQNAKYDVLVLRAPGVTLRGLDFDTMLASYVLDPGRRSHGLDVLALEFSAAR